jgi:branched-chain amino acid transport system ATP-binding protein
VLDVHGLTVGYGDVPVVHGIDLHVGAGELVALLGPNGAGKTTTMLALSGVIPASGDISFDDQPLRGPLHRRARRGIGLITEERAVFRQLSTRTNLGLGAGGLEGALAHFPELERLLDRTAGLLSGGEQQMLVLARALAAKPRLLLVDELSLGLAPMIVQRLLRALRDAAAQGTGVLLVEQHARHALEIADRGYVLLRGNIDLHGSGAELLGRLGEIERRYLGGLDAVTD